MEIFVNCDTEKKDTPGDLWYSVAEILTKGIVTPNGCLRAKDVDKFKAREAKPGEIVLFMRTKNLRERAQD
jgi:hypothetical protein